MLEKTCKVTVSNLQFCILQKEEEQVQAIADDNKSDEDFDKLKDESKEKDSPKKVKPAVKRTPKVWEFKHFFDYIIYINSDLTSFALKQPAVKQN